jgi:hypothetical protein
MGTSSKLTEASHFFVQCYMKPRFFWSVLALLVVVAQEIPPSARDTESNLSAADETKTEPASNEGEGGLVMRLGRFVRVLSFDTDDFVDAARIIVNGEQVGFQSWSSGPKGFKAVIVKKQRSRPNLTGEVEIYMQVGDVSTSKAGACRFERPNTILKEFIFPKKTVPLNGWTKIYGFSQTEGTNVYDLRLEIVGWKR